ncbi:MAG: hemerythrin domain-containing protein [Microthrixaceae bacterium]
MTPDLYTLAHKPLRLAVSHTAVLVGAAEPDSVEEIAEPVSGVVAELLNHASHEDHFIDPLLARFLPDLALEIASQHERLGASIEAVQRQVDQLTRGAKVAAGGPLTLYRAFQRMAAMNLLHLDYEETIVMPALWTATPDGALAEVMAAFNAAHPEASQLFHRWPAALTPTERANFGITNEEHSGAQRLESGRR